MAPMEPNGYTTTFNRLIKEMLADQPQDFLEKTSFGKGLTEEDRRRREQERAEREAEREAEKEAANPTNKTTRYGGVIYFVFLDNYLGDAEKKLVVVNANKILKLNEIPADVVGIQHPLTGSLKELEFSIQIKENKSAIFPGLYNKTTYKVVWLGSLNSFPEAQQTTGAKGYTTGENYSYVYLDTFDTCSYLKPIPNEDDGTILSSSNFDKPMLIALTAIHELYHQIQFEFSVNVHTDQFTSQSINANYYDLEVIKDTVKNFYKYMNEEKNDIYSKGIKAFARCYQSGILYDDWNPVHWRRKLDTQKVKRFEAPEFNIMKKSEPHIAFPMPNRFDRGHSMLMFVSVDSFITKLYFKYHVGFYRNENIDITTIIEFIYQNYKEDGIKIFYSRYIKGDFTKDFPSKSPNDIILKKVFNTIWSFLPEITKKDNFPYEYNFSIKKI